MYINTVFKTLSYNFNNDILQNTMYWVFYNILQEKFGKINNY